MNLLDLFTGTGAFSLGLERAGFKTVAICDYDEACRQRLKQIWPDVPQYNDVRTLTGKQLIGDGIVDIQAMCGGFPCQDLSFSGEGEGLDGERSGLWNEYKRLIGEIRPRFAFIENVTALLVRGLDRVLCDLASLGYNAEWHCIPSSSVGGVSRRDRCWIIAYPFGERPPRSGRYINAVHSAPDAYREASGIVDAFQRNALPYVCGRHPRITSKLDRENRLIQVGNSLDPAIPELLGRAIMNA